MSAGIRLASPLPGRGRSERRQADRIGDGLLYGLCIVAALLAVLAIGAIAYQVIHGASASISRFGLGFLTHTTWEPNFGIFGAGAFLFGTAVTSLITLLLAVPIGVSIALYLSMVAPRRLRSVIGPLVEMLAAIPSVILGFWGILVFGPFLQAHLEPFLHSVLGFLPIFGAPATTGTGLFNASLILTIMVVPIIASVSRDLFLTVPQELQDGATALGSTRWEVLRGVVIPSAASGVIAAAFLGLGRALGEAIAVTQVIGAGNLIHASLFQTGDTLASRIADQYQGATTKLQISSLFNLGLILLVIGLLANIAAQLIARRFDVRRVLAQ
ncbi:MAG TPA: phosphate ABC transporter permease subunit PstC [Solirubrobacteraceae bacterium]|jgi:phosphate transport system permease protein|nr:phosphate ABC transporter permease subunit PstC [Solirubrobacteraceae bacterium]